MVLVYQEESEGVMTEIEARRREQRRAFQQNLLKEGLQLELEPKENSFDGKTYFLKLHIPWKIKMQYAEVMNIKLPTKRFITISVKAWVCPRRYTTYANTYYRNAIIVVYYNLATLLHNRYELLPKHRAPRMKRKRQNCGRNVYDGGSGYVKYILGTRKSTLWNPIFMTV